MAPFSATPVPIPRAYHIRPTSDFLITKETLLIDLSVIDQPHCELVAPSSLSAMLQYTSLTSSKHQVEVTQS